MPTNTYTGSLPVPPEDVYAFLADVRNLPRYLPLMSGASPRDDGDVEITTEVKGGVHTMTAWFRPDAATRHIEWGAVENAGYHGWVTVRAAEQGGTTIDYGIESPREHTLEPYFRAATEFLVAALAPSR